MTKVKETIEQMVAALERTDLWLKARCDGIGLVGDEIEALQAGHALLEQLRSSVEIKQSRSDVGQSAEHVEPVAWIDKENPDVIVSAKDWDNIDPIWYWMYRPLYTTSQQRTWVGLTDEEKSELWEVSRAALPRYATYASLVEAKLKEKNT